MKEFIKNKKKIIINVITLLLVVIAISILSAFIFMLFGIISFEDGLTFNTELFNNFKNSWYGSIIFIVFQSLATILLCAIPGVSMGFIILSTNMFETPWQAFLVSFISVMLSSFLMYLVGRFGGYKLCVKMLGKDDCEKSLELLRNKSTIYFPLMMLFPVFPDDALVMIAGTLKMKLKWFIPSIIIGRGIGILTIVFGFTIIPFSEFTSLYDWIVFITVCVFWILLIFNIAHKFNEKIEKSHKENN